MAIIYLAGGCFWGVEAYFSQLKGVNKTTCGYANGNMANPSYNEVKAHIATHAETVEVVYDEQVLSLATLLGHFLRFVNPYSLNKQGEDQGIQYRSGIYYTDPRDEKIIKEYFEAIELLNKRQFLIEVLPLVNFYVAEDYHQAYLEKNPHGYCHVNLGLIKPEEKKVKDGRDDQI